VAVSPSGHQFREGFFYGVRPSGTKKGEKKAFQNQGAYPSNQRLNNGAEK
jgi:hypothetical protein